MFMDNGIHTHKRIFMRSCLPFGHLSKRYFILMDLFIEMDLKFYAVRSLLCECYSIYIRLIDIRLSDPFLVRSGVGNVSSSRHDIM